MQCLIHLNLTLVSVSLWYSSFRQVKTQQSHLDVDQHLLEVVSVQFQSNASLVQLQ